MIISLIVVIPGVVLVLVVALAGGVTRYGRQADPLLVAPRNAGFGEASRLVRAEATRERARADLQALTNRRTTAPALTLVKNETTRTGQRAA